MKIDLEFSGGMEILFNNTKTIELPDWSSEDGTMKSLIAYIADTLLDSKESRDLFVKGNTVRPGILVLINDTDWELENELEYIIKEGDKIVFISTLHGG